MRLPKRKSVNSRRQQLLRHLMLSLSIAAPAALFGSHLAAQEVNSKDNSGSKSSKVVLPSFPTTPAPSVADTAKSKSDSQTSAPSKLPNANAPALLAADKKQTAPSVTTPGSTPLPLFPQGNSGGKVATAPTSTALPTLPPKVEEKKSSASDSASNQSHANSTPLAKLPPLNAPQLKDSSSADIQLAKPSEDKAANTVGSKASGNVPLESAGANGSGKSSDENKSVTIRFGGEPEKAKPANPTSALNSLNISAKSEPSAVASGQKANVTPPEKTSFRLSDKGPATSSPSSESSARLSFKDTPAASTQPKNTNSSAAANSSKANSPAISGTLSSSDVPQDLTADRQIVSGSEKSQEKSVSPPKNDQKMVAGGKVDAFSQDRKDSSGTAKSGADTRTDTTKVASTTGSATTELVKPTPIKPLTISAEGITSSQPKPIATHPEAVIIRPKVLVLDAEKSKAPENLAKVAPAAEKAPEHVVSKPMSVNETSTQEISKQSVASEVKTASPKAVGELIAPAELPKFPSTDLADVASAPNAPVPTVTGDKALAGGQKKVDSKVSALPPNMLASQPKSAVISKAPVVPATPSSITIAEEPKLSAIPLPPPPTTVAEKKPVAESIVSKEVASQSTAAPPNEVQTKVVTPALIASQPILGGAKQGQSVVAVAPDPKADVFKLAAAKIEPKKYDKPADRTIQVGTIALTTMRIGELVVEKCEVDDASICRTLVTADGEVAFLPGKVGVTRATLWIKQPDGKSKVETADIQVGEVLAEAKPFALEIEQLNARLTALYPGTSLRAESGDRCIEIHGEAESEQQAKEVLQLVRKLCLVPVKDKVSVR